MTAPDAVEWQSLWGKVVVPLSASIVVAYLLSTLLNLRKVAASATRSPSRRKTASTDWLRGRLHWISAGAVGAARGLNDTPKLAAVAGFALVPAGMPPSALVALISGAMAVGAVAAGTRVARRLGEDLIKLDAATGLRANLVTALLVGVGGGNGLPMSTTHVSTGAITGVAGLRARRLNLTTLGLLVFERGGARREEIRLGGDRAASWAGGLAGEAGDSGRAEGLRSGCLAPVWAIRS